MAALAAVLAVAGVAAAATAASSGPLVSAAIFPAVSSKPTTVLFSGFINTSGPARGDLKFVQYCPGCKQPLYQHDFGVQDIRRSGEWFNVSERLVFDKPGDYEAALYFNRKLIGWTPVDFTAPSGR